MKTGKLHLKNKKTNKHEIIEQIDIKIEDWGLIFLVKTELEAYKAAQEYRNNKYPVLVEYAASSDQWLITVLNELGNKIVSK